MLDKNSKTFPRPHPLALFFRWVSISWGYLEGWTAKIFPSQWELKGGCQKTGACCHLIALELPQFSLRFPWLYRCFTRFGVWWNEKISGFTYVGKLNERWLGFTCNRLGPDNTCMDYKNRPRVCRQYPTISYFGKPNLYKGCGYRLSLRPSKIKVLKD